MAIEPTTSTAPEASRGRNNLQAVGYMLVTVLGISFIPLIVNLANGSQSPFLFSTGLRMGSSITCLVFLFTFHRSTLLNRNTLSSIGKRILTWPDNKFLIAATIAALDYALFAWSLQFIDIAVAAIVFETWPLFVILLAAWLFREEGRYRKIAPTTYMLILLSLAGFVFAIASQTTDFDYLDDAFLWNSVIGGTLIVSSTFLGIVGNC